MNDPFTTERVHNLYNVPRTGLGTLLSRGFTPMLVTAPRIGTRLVWKELYQANAYAETYYLAATYRSITQ